MRPNKYPGRCVECSVSVPAGEGTLAERPDRWDTVCAKPLCRQLVYGLEAPANPRVLRADGTIPLPHKGHDTPLLEAIATWDQPAGVWRATPSLADRALVTELCGRMGVDLDAWARACEKRDADEARSTREASPAMMAHHVSERARETCGGREYQVAGSHWLYLHNRALLADDMGLGKCKQLLDAVYYLKMGVLILAPAVVKGVWLREIAKWCPDRFDSIVVCEGWGSFRWPSHARECVIVNYDLVPPQKAELKNAVKAIKAAFTERSEFIDMFGWPDAADPRWWKLTQKLWKAWRALYRLRNQGAGHDGRQWTTAREIVKNTPTVGKTPRGVDVVTVFDEVHKLKSNKALQTKRCRVLSKHSTRCYGLTGTPIENDPLELWGVLTSIGCTPPQWRGVDKNGKPNGWFKFLAAFGGWRKDHGGFGFDVDDNDAIIVKPGTTEILRRVMLRRVKADVGQDLPPVTFGEHPVPLSDKLIAQLEDLEPEIRELLESGELPKIGKYAQLRKALATSRILAMLEIVKSFEEAGLPLLVLSAHRGPVLKLAKRKGWHTITGDVSGAKRTLIEESFQAGEGVGVAGTFRSMGVGITLTRAAHVLIVDQDLTPTANDQGIKRVDRIGQTNNVHVTIMYSDHPLDEEVSKMLVRKSALVSRTLHGDYSPRG